MTHQLSAKPDDIAQGALIRSNSGDSYARMRLTQINYPDATSPKPPLGYLNLMSSLLNK